MTTKKALEIKKALITLSEALSTDLQQIASNVCFLDDNKYQVLKEASNIWNKFEEADLVERGKMLGIKIKYHK